MSDVNLALTTAGLSLKAKIEAGNGTIPLTITRIVTASGTSNDPLNLTGVVNIEQEFTITDKRAIGARTAISAILTNQGNSANGEQPLGMGYLLSQIGFYAIDPDDGEILYRISQFESPNYVPAAKERGWIYEPTFNFVTDNASEVVVSIDPAGLGTLEKKIEEMQGFNGATFIGYDRTKSELDARNVQDAIDELSCCFILDAEIVYDLDVPRPLVALTETNWGYGVGGYGEFYGGEPASRAVPCRPVYLDQNTLKLSLGKQYQGNPEVEKITGTEYVIRIGNLTLNVHLYASNAASEVYVSKAEPEKWRPGDWWYREMNPRDIFNISASQQTIKQIVATTSFKEDGEYFVVVDEQTETISNFEDENITVKIIE